MNKILMTFAFLIFSSAALALPVDYNKYCSNQPDKSVLMICRTAVQFDVPVMKAGVAVQDCKKIKVHKKLEGTAVPEDKKKK